VSLTQLASAADRAAAERDHAITSPSALRTLTSPASPSPTMRIFVADIAFADIKRFGNEWSTWYLYK
jgi:hypothetical protein